MKYSLKGGDQEFDRFKDKVNQQIPGLSKKWWDKIEVHLHGGIYSGQDELGIIDHEGEENVSKIVTLTAIIGYAYLSADWEEEAKLVHYIDAIHNRYLAENFRLPLDDGLFNRRKFINFINILLKHAEQTELYRSALDIKMKGNLLKRQSSNYHDRWDKAKNTQGNIIKGKWVPKKGVPGSRAHQQIPGFNINLFRDPLFMLTSMAGPNATDYGNITDSVDKLSTRKMFVHLIFLLKEFVTKAYQLDSEDLDYQMMDYRIALKIVEGEINEEFADKYIDELVRPGVQLLTPNGLEKVNEVFENVLDGMNLSPTLAFFRIWGKMVSSKIEELIAGERAVKESLLDMTKEYELPKSYETFYTPILITHLLLYEKQEESKKEIFRNVASQFRNFRDLSKEIIAEEYQEIVSSISELWAIMYAWHNLYGRIYKKYIRESSLPRFEKEHVRFDQKMKSTELAFWTQYLNLRFQTIEYKEDLDLSPDPTTFKKAFARVEVLQKKLEPRFSNPPLVVMPHLHRVLGDIVRRGLGGISERLEQFKSNDELIYDNEKEYIHQLKSVAMYESQIDKIVKEDYSNAQGKPEYKAQMKWLGEHKQSVNWMKGFLIDMVNATDIQNLILYYEALIEDDDVGPDQLQFVREWKEKYKEDVSFLYDFEHVENRMIGNANSIYNEAITDFTEKNMTEILKKEGNIDRILFINDDIKDSKDEIVPETEFADIWPERKRYLDNIFKEVDEDESDLSDFLKVPLGDDPLQRRWISSVKNLVNPMDELKKNFIQERRSKYATSTEQGKVAIQAAQKAKRLANFQESSKAFHEKGKEASKKLQKTTLLHSIAALTIHKDKPLKRINKIEPTTPLSISKGVGVLENKRLWKRSGIGKDKYEDELFIIDENETLDDDQVLPAFIEEIQDLERRGKMGEKVRMVVEDRKGEPMKDRDDPEGEAYLGSNMMALKPDYGKLQFNTIKEVTDFKLPVKIGQTSEGEDVYQRRPFLTLHRQPKDLRRPRSGGRRKKQQTFKEKKKSRSTKKKK